MHDNRRHRRSLQAHRLLMVPIIAIGLLAACTSDDDNSSPAPTEVTEAAPGATEDDRPPASAATDALDDESPGSVVIATVAGYLAPYAPVNLAFGLGYLDEVAQQHDVTIEERALQAGPDVTALFLSGEADFMIQGIAQNVIAANEGRDVVAVMNLGQGPGVVAVGADEHESRGTNVAAYADETFGYTREGSSSQTYLKALAERAGLDWSSDLTPLALGGVEGIIPGLASGTADIIMTDAGIAARAVAMGEGYVIFNSYDPDDAEAVWGEQLGVAVASSSEFTQRYPNLTRDIIGALRRASEFIQANIDDPDAIYDASTAEFRENVDRADFAGTWLLSKESFLVDGTFAPEVVDRTMDLLLDIGAVPEGTQVPENFFDNSFVS
jgi:ABC-type nitrate/sulfonate/bicarbonate transport system substrate-binding protein